MISVTAKFRAAVRAPHQIVARATITDGAGNTLLDSAPILDGSVTLDRTAAIRGRADLQIAFDPAQDLVPTTAASALAPYGHEVTICRGVRYLDGTEETVPLGVFRLEDVTVSDDASGVSLRVAAQDRAARLIDARLEDPYQVASGGQYGAAIISLLTDAWPSMPYVAADFAALTSSTPAVPLAEGADRWAAARSMATACGCDLFFDGDGKLRARAASNTSSTPVEAIDEGQNGVLITVAKSWKRAGAYNRVIATGEAIDGAAPPRGVATDDNAASPTYYYGPFGRVPRFYASPFIADATQAASAAAAILADSRGTTQAVTWGSLVLPHLEPGDAVQITRQRTHIAETHVIDSLTIPLSAAGVMQGTTRTVSA